MQLQLFKYNSGCETQQSRKSFDLTKVFLNVHSIQHVKM